MCVYITHMYMSIHLSYANDCIVMCVAAVLPWPRWCSRWPHSHATTGPRESLGLSAIIIGMTIINVCDRNIHWHVYLLMRARPGFFFRPASSPVRSPPFLVSPLPFQCNFQCLFWGGAGVVINNIIK